MPAWRLLLGCSGLLMTGCLMSRSAVKLPAGGPIVRDQLIIHSDFPLPRHHRLVDELVALRGDIVERLVLPVSDEPIYVHLFESRAQFRRYMETHYPQFPERRAFFVETDTRLCVYAHWGDRVAEDLRHEVAHGYVHTMVPRIPLWMDEGLAEFFEVPRGDRGLHRPHLALLASSPPSDWVERLEELETLDEPADMTQADYAAAWAWVHFLLESSDERTDVFRNHLARLRMTGTAPSLADTVRAMDPFVSTRVHQHLRLLAEGADPGGGRPPLR